jgi:hypothetical protein
MCVRYLRTACRDSRSPVGCSDHRLAQPGSGEPRRLLVVLDCVDANALADFWSSVLGFRRGSFHPPYVRLVDPRERWPNLLLQQVPEPKSGKNRMHLDIRLPMFTPKLSAWLPWARASLIRRTTTRVS